MRTNICYVVIPKATQKRDLFLVNLSGLAECRYTAIQFTASCHMVMEIPNNLRMISRSSFIKKVDLLAQFFGERKESKAWQPMQWNVCVGKSSLSFLRYALLMELCVASEEHRVRKCKQNVWSNIFRRRRGFSYLFRGSETTRKESSIS